MPRRPSRYVGWALTRRISSSPVKTQLSETPLSSIARGSAAGTTSERASPQKMLRACSASTARTTNWAESPAGRWAGAARSTAASPARWRPRAPRGARAPRAPPRAAWVRPGGASGARAASVPLRRRPPSCPWGPSCLRWPGALVVLEEPAQPFLRAEDAGLHGAHRAIHDARHVLQGQSLDLGQQERRLELLGQPRQGPIQIQVGPGARAVAAGGVMEHGRIPIRGSGLREGRFELTKAVERQERVPQDLEQPGAEMGSRLEPVGEPHGPDVGLLDKVLGLGAVPGEVDGQVVEGVQVLEGLLPELVVSHGTPARPGAVPRSAASGERGRPGPR